MFPTPLQKAIKRGMKEGGNLREELWNIRDHNFESTADAHAASDALRQLVEAGVLSNDERFQALTGLILRVSSQEALDVLSTEALDHIVTIFDRSLSDTQTEVSNSTLGLLKLIAMFKDVRVVERVAAAAYKPLESGSYLWSSLFHVFNENHPHWPAVVDALRDPLPPDFIAIAYLDFANTHAIRGDLNNHPFNSKQGIDLLTTLLTNDGPGEYSFARSATAALPFISNPHRTLLMSIAMDHTEPEVQLEAAWASAKLGSDAGFAMLARFAEDPLFSRTACQLLQELDGADRIPDIAKDPTFAAKAEMCSWLAHPMEFGRTPDKIELLDTREIFWPPTNDRRQVWLFKYTYNGHDDEEDDIGVGMVGSVTFALFGEPTKDLSPEHIYGLHCCSELKSNNDPRTPPKRDGQLGWNIIQDHQQ